VLQPKYLKGLFASFFFFNNRNTVFLAIFLRIINKKIKNTHGVKETYAIRWLPCHKEGDEETKNWKYYIVKIPPFSDTQNGVAQ
jgi:hypothetical protein